MKTKTKSKLTKYAALSLLIGSSAFAQGGGHVGGGDPTAADFQNYINKIDSYLLTSVGQAAFPELKQPEFHQIISKVKPVVKDERVYDSFGVSQACVSHVEEGNRFFQCDVKRLPKVELNNQPTFYRLTFHELLFQIGLELPISKSVPSDFSISSKLKLRLETHQEWTPGSEEEDQQTFAQTGIHCNKANIHFYWLPNGDYLLFHHDEPRGQREWGGQGKQFNVSGMSKAGIFLLDVKNTFSYLLARLTSRKARTEVIARGNSLSILENVPGTSVRSIGSKNTPDQFMLRTDTQLESLNVVRGVTPSGYYPDKRTFIAEISIWERKWTSLSGDYICENAEWASNHLDETHLQLGRMFKNASKNKFKTNYFRRSWGSRF